MRSRSWWCVNPMIRRLLALALVNLTACLALFGLCSTVDAQQPASPRRIGVLLLGWSCEQKEVHALHEGLRDAGYVEGHDVAFECRSAGGDFNQIPQLAAGLVQSKVDVIVVVSTLATRALKRATSTIPIVMALVADPVGSGLVASLAHPGENVTGLSQMMPDLSAKGLQLLKETIPRVTRVAVLWNPDTPYHPKVIEELKAAAPSLSLELSFVAARRPKEFDRAFSAVTRAHAQALYVIADALFVLHRKTLLSFASKDQLPGIYAERVVAEAGGLMSFGTNYEDLFRRAAGYVDKILKGAKPADLPIEQPTKFELVVNLKTAKALGITIPESILLRADQVIR